MLALATGGARLWVRLLFLFFPLVLVFVFPFADVFRSGTDGELKTTNAKTSLSSDLDYDAFTMQASAVESGMRGLQLGRRFIGSAIFFVPRTVWPGKPEISTVYVSETSRSFNASNTNVSLPIQAEFFLDFGYLGTIVGMGLMGVVASKISFDSSLIAPRQIPQIVFVGLLIIVCRGSLAAVAAVTSLSVGFASIGARSIAL